MPFELDVPEEFSEGGNFLQEPGTYHVNVLASLEGQSFPTRNNPDGKPIDGFAVKLGVLAGTVEGQVDKLTTINFFNGNLQHKDQGKFARQKITFFAYANDLLDPNADQKGKRVSIDITKSNGRQFIIRLEKTKDGYLEIAFSDIWHVDDPRAKEFPKNEQALAMIPKELRHDAKYFDVLTTKKGGEQSQKQPAPQKDAETASAGSGVSFSDL